MTTSLRTLTYRAALVAALSPAGAMAQTGGSCGNQAMAQERVNDFLPLFADTTQAAFREHAPAMQILQTGDSVGVVADSTVCAQLRTALAGVPGVLETGDSADTYELEFFRFGEYYAVLLDAQPDAYGTGTLAGGYTPLLVFRRSDLAYLKRTMV